MPDKVGTYLVAKKQSRTNSFGFDLIINMDREFNFNPDFGHVESFLKFYQAHHASGYAVSLKLNVLGEYYATMPGYPDATRNAWITLRFAVEQMNQSFYNQKSKVQVEVIISGVHS